MTPSERQLRGRLGGFALAAKRDPKTYTASARAAFMDRFLNEVDPERILTPDERERRAVAARRAYFARRLTSWVAVDRMLSEASTEEYQTDGDEKTNK